MFKCNKTAILNANIGEVHLLYSFIGRDRIGTKNWIMDEYLTIKKFLGQRA